jgi:hypothetical protein
MTGMKEGAGEDPFAETAEAEEPTESEPAPSNEEPTETEHDDTGDERARERTQPPERREIQIPYKFRRDGVQDGRSRVPLFLQKETKRAERDAQRELEDRFSDDVSLTDLREALVLTGLEHLDEVEVELEKWGYGMTFSE